MHARFALSGLLALAASSFVSAAPNPAPTAAPVVARAGAVDIPGSALL